MEFCRQKGMAQKQVLQWEGRRAFVHAEFSFLIHKYSRGQTIFPPREAKRSSAAPMGQCDQTDKPSQDLPQASPMDGAGSQKNGELPLFKPLETLLFLVIKDTATRPQAVLPFQQRQSFWSLPGPSHQTDNCFCSSQKTDPPSILAQKTMGCTQM